MSTAAGIASAQAKSAPHSRNRTFGANSFGTRVLESRGVCIGNDWLGGEGGDTLLGGDDCDMLDGWDGEHFLDPKVLGIW